MDMMQTLSQELSVPRGQIESAVRLMDEGNTIPFIARYRKEATGGLDDTVLRNLSERLSYLRNLEKRRQEVFALVEESGKLEGKELEQLRAALEKAQMLSEIEDLYRPYRPKRRTRASVARERGLEGLAHFLKEQRLGGDLQREATKYVDPDKEVPDTAAAIAGAGDILAEELSDSARLRGQLREYLQKNRSDFDNNGDKRKRNIPDVFRIQRIDPQNSLPSGAGHRPGRAGGGAQGECRSRPRALRADGGAGAGPQKLPLCKGAAGGVRGQL